MKKILKISTIMLMMLLSLVLFMQNTQASELNFAVEPVIPDNQRDKTKSYFDLHVQPNTEQIIEVNLRNDTDTEVTVEPSVHSATTNLNGVVEYGKVDEKKDKTLKYDLNDLVKVDKEIKIPSQSSIKVPMKIQIPEEKFDGILAGGITFKEKEKENKNDSSQNGLSIENKYAYVVALVLNESDTELKSDLQLKKVFPDQVNSRNVINATIQNTQAKYVNQLKIEAKVTKKNSDKILYTSKKEQMQMAPNSTFNYPISLDSKPLKSGQYTLKMSAYSKDDEWHWDENFTIKNSVAKKLNKKDVSIEHHNAVLYTLILVILLIVIMLIILFKKNKNRKKQN
ncbi:DUF916 and DUF3324 domain-containing protein [Carnobacterium divergens]|uniref:DUF916 and DUF3324 domain-containing protein n=1 Tax=Carnobacterium divergens TaxID=2748 RepID=A0AAW8RBQ7_CARDV|nr:DUF916 and DUF3324 domain-containing protein [Carnobacterium divergens]MDT1958939.1 DUF916 and DUF3324 domain-containing protein [Carnobacterium divergens]MDT1974907.1 DUF916 and DUF3324 domain-containing protein [Carnobacterium divergens]MDT2012959.1 DUF916 and DUF3324 domain-containing protein [Carnobacterium divergens]